MTTKQKAEKRTNKKGEITPAPAKANGKRKINKDNVPAKAPIDHPSSSNSHNNKSNGAQSILKSKSKSLDEKEQVAGKDDVLDRNVQVSPETNGIDDSKKKKKKEVKEDKNEKKKKKKKMKGDIEEKDDSLLYQIPMSRVSRIIKSEDPNVRITQEAVYIINKASEKFLEVFTTEAFASAFLDRKKYIDYKHLSSVVSKRRRFDFLSDFVPEKVKAEDALMESQTVEN